MEDALLSHPVIFSNDVQATSEEARVLRPETNSAMMSATPVPTV